MAGATTFVPDIHGQVANITFGPGFLMFLLSGQLLVGAVA